MGVTGALRDPAQSPRRIVRHGRTPSREAVGVENAEALGSRLPEEPGTPRVERAWRLS
jgi:hypothetical protein